MKNKNKQTKFPVARIKKIMQKDEEVGKVAQATPIVISKALELFLALIIEEAHKVTAERGAKKVEAYHLKHAIETTEMLDFLKEIVEGVPDPSAGGTIDFESENAEGGKKKRGKGKKASGEPGTRKRRKRKGEPEAEGAAAEGEVDGPEKDQDGDTTMQNGQDARGKSEDGAGQRTSPTSDDGGDYVEDKPFMPRR